MNTERRTLHIRLGKGHKDRMVPIGARAVAWLERYLQEVRPRLCLDTRTQALFLTGYGGLARHSNSTSRSRCTRTCVKLHPQYSRSSFRLKVGAPFVPPDFFLTSS